MDHHIAVLANQRAHAVAFVADDDGGRAGQIRLVHGNGALGGGAVDPDTLLLQFRNGGIDIGDPGYLHILHRAGGCLGNGGGEANATALGDDHTMGTGALGRAHDRAQVMGIAEFVTDDDQGIFTPGGCFLQNIVNGEVHMGSGQGNDALMGMGGGHLIQLPAVHGNHHGTGFLGLGCQTLQRPVRITRCHKYLINGAAGAEGFGQGIAALQLTLYLLHGGTVSKAVGTAGRIIALRAAFFIHNVHLHDPSGRKPGNIGQNDLHTDRW